MDQKDKRRLEHLQRLQKNHHDDFKERHTTEKTRRKLRQEKIANDVSADWNRKQKQAQAAQATQGGKPLPEGWRDAHWKTLQAMAFEFTGVKARDKDASVKALEAYEVNLAEKSAD